MNHGNIEFFTVTCLNWQTLLKDDKHMHILWRKQDDWIEKNVQQHFLKYTAQQIKFSLLKDNPAELIHYTSTQKDRQFHFWERRPYRARTFTRVVVEQKINYIHYNPVKAGLCKLPEDYLFSSAQYYYLNRYDPMITHYMEHL